MKCAPRRLRDVSRRLQDAPKTLPIDFLSILAPSWPPTWGHLGSQDASKTPPRRPQEGPRRPQDAPKKTCKTPQDTKRLPRGPKTPPRRPKTPPRRPQDAPRRPLRCPEYIYVPKQLRIFYEPNYKSNAQCPMPREPRYSSNIKISRPETRPAYEL